MDSNRRPGAYEANRRKAAPGWDPPSLKLIGWEAGSRQQGCLTPSTIDLGLKPTLKPYCLAADPLECILLCQLHGPPVLWLILTRGNWSFQAGNNGLVPTPVPSIVRVLLVLVSPHVPQVGLHNWRGHLGCGRTRRIPVGRQRSRKGPCRWQVGFLRAASQNPRCNTQ